MSLAERLKAQIAASGPLTIAQYMTICLHDPQGGYYSTRPRLGEDGDFVTAPLVSQMFGELLGLWAVEVWSRLGRPARVRLVEVGPGDGSLMSDALRAARLAPAFLAAAELVLIEPSPALALAQHQRLSAGPLAPCWIDGLAALVEGPPVILIANELLDCLPARQFVRLEHKWAERMVGLDGNGALSFGLGACPVGRALPDAAPGSVFELSPAQEAFGSDVGALLVRDGGAALLIDYGRSEAQMGDTLQALKGHRRISPLMTPGEADLTVHVDFPAVAEAGMASGAAASAILSQGEFLRRLGLVQRAAALTSARPDRADVLGRQFERLVAPDQMGTLFKALALYFPRSLTLPGFEEP